MNFFPCILFGLFAALIFDVWESSHTNTDKVSVNASEEWVDERAWDETEKEKRLFLCTANKDALNTLFGGVIVSSASLPELFLNCNLYPMWLPIVYEKNNESKSAQVQGDEMKKNLQILASDSMRQPQKNPEMDGVSNKIEAKKAVRMYPIWNERMKRYQKQNWREKRKEWNTERPNHKNDWNERTIDEKKCAHRQLRLYEVWTLKPNFYFIISIHIWIWVSTVHCTLCSVIYSTCLDIIKLHWELARKSITM